jgi:hypothetical protein
MPAIHEMMAMMCRVLSQRYMDDNLTPHPEERAAGVRLEG